MSTTTSTTTSTHKQAPLTIDGRFSIATADGWLADLHRDGYAVIKGAIPADRAKAYQKKAFDWLQSFGHDELDLANPETWVHDNLPVHGKVNTFTTYGVVHERFMWEARQEPAILQAFAKIWGTDQLLASFDALNITLPNRRDVKPNGAWPHVDQSPYKEGMHCVQGIINLSHAGPSDGSLMVFPGSHKLVKELFATQLPKSEWSTEDYYLFKDEHMEWFASKGMQAKKVLAEPGDLILWDSRTVHWGAEPSPESKTIRTVIYASYAPADLATPESLVAKQAIFRNWGATTHWASTNIFPLQTKSIRHDGTRDPKDREEPLEKPEMTDKLLRLAGIKAY
ncbi:hypothetical protein SCUCBS95973_009144 [Sporothrix curviconia]|uniref:Phytanoyl-CoA dioxygenase n=1 Tax=Sporothrix curviconia TaxID=1260050 RepID=A0ABP0CU26_9PEZI